MANLPPCLTSISIETFGVRFTIDDRSTVEKSLTLLEKTICNFLCSSNCRAQKFSQILLETLSRNTFQSEIHVSKPFKRADCFCGCEFKPRHRGNLIGERQRNLTKGWRRNENEGEEKDANGGSANTLYRGSALWAFTYGQ